MRECIGAASDLRRAHSKRQLRPVQAPPSLSRTHARLQRLLLLSVSAAALAALSPRSAAAQTWTGATSNDWTVGSNWNGGTAPAGGAVNIVAGSTVVLGVTGAATGTTSTLNVRDAVGSPSSLTIQNGSALTSTSSVSISDTAGGTATVTVTGAGSQWNATTITAGTSGAGIVNIENGATIVMTSRIILGTPAALGTGTLNITNATLQTTNITAGNSSSRANFDNAVVRATADSASFFGGTVGQNNLAAGGLTFDTNGHTVGTLGFSGVGGLTKTGAGTLTLRTGSTFTGDTVIQQGTLALIGPSPSGADALATSNRVVVNATFDVSAIPVAASHIQSLAGTGTVVLGAKDLIVTNGHDTFAGSIGGTGGLQVTGGTQALSSAQAYSGATTIAAGSTLALSGAGSVAASSQVIANGTFSIAGLTGSGTSIQHLTGGGAVDLGAKTLTLTAANDTFSGVIGGAGGGLTVNGSQTLTGVNTYSGTTEINTGTLALTGNGSIASSRMVANGTFDISGINATASQVQSLGGNGSVTLGAKDLVIANASDTFAGAIGGTGGLQITGGTQALSAAQAYSGATTIAGGTLALTGNGDIAASSQVIANGTFSIAGLAGAGTSIQRLSGSGAVDLGAKTLTIAAANDTFAGVIGGSGGGLTINGTQTLTGANTYSGLTTISAGTLALTGAGSIANSSVVANATFDISGVAGASAGIQSLAGNGSVALGAKDLVISNAHDTFAGVITGTGGLQVTGGTQALSATQAYGGATTISGGTLALTGNGSLAASSGVIANGTFSIAGLAGAGTSLRRLSGTGSVDLGAKTLTLTNANDTFSGVISGSGGLTVNGTQTLSGVNSYSGATTLTGGTLRAGAAGAFSAASAFAASAGAELDLNGFNQTVASLTNAGTLRFGAAPGTTLTLSGNYVGNGGTLLFNSVLGGDASATDRLVVQGSTAGSSTVRVANAGGGGAQTVEGIKLIDVTGASNGSFALIGDYVLQGQQAMVAGAYAYTLQKNGVATPTDGDWYLRSSLVNQPTDPGDPTPPPPPPPAGPLYQPGVPLYENYAQILLGMNALPSLQERVGNRYWNGDPSAAMARMGPMPAAAASTDASWTQSAFWGRVEGGQANMRPSNTTGSTYNADQYKAQAGLDGVAIDNDRGRLIVGLTAQYGLTTAYVNSFYGNGRIRVEGSGVGATATWYGHNGVYVDGQAQTMFYRGDLSSDLVGGMTHGNEGLGYAVSVEGGKRIGVGNGFFLTPQAQLAYSKVEFDAFTDRFGALVSLANADSLLGRVGLMLNQQKSWTNGTGLVRSDLYAIGNLHYEFLDGSKVDVAGTSFASANDRLWGSIGGGGSYSWANGRYTLFGEATYRASLQQPADSHSYKGTAGFRVVW